MATFSVEMGVPEMSALWEDLLEKHKAKTLDADETILLRKLRKAILLLSMNPKHPGLESHDISALSDRFGVRVWQSYLENRTPAAGRLFWVYGGEHGEKRLCIRWRVPDKVIKDPGLSSSALY